MAPVMKQGDFRIESSSRWDQNSDSEPFENRACSIIKSVQGGKIRLQQAWIWFSAQEALHEVVESRHS